MTRKAKIIVLDANILIRAVLGVRTFSLIAKHRDRRINRINTLSEPIKTKSTGDRLTKLHIIFSI